MNRRCFVKAVGLVAVAATSAARAAAGLMKMDNKLRIRFVRNATLFMEIDGLKFLVDPMLGEKGSFEAIPWTNDLRNPTVDLPMPGSDVRAMIAEADYIVLTHLHPDHWDEAARRMIPKQKAVICQRQDAETLVAQGFTNLHTDQVNSGGLKIIRVEARHGHGELAESLAPVSGYVFACSKVSVYITGDTVWYEGVKKVLDQYQPDVIVVNAGGAKFQHGDPITMNEADVVQVVRHSKPAAKVVAVHMEAVNHCYLSRQALKEYVSQHGLAAKCLVPADGEQLDF